MSNKCIYFFLLIAGLHTALYAQEATSLNGDPIKWLQQAEDLYEKEQYTASLSTYEDLYRKNYFTEHMLLRMAFLYENQNRIPEAIFALRKSNETFGTNPVEPKIARLKEQLGRRSVLAAERPGSWHLWIGKWQWIILGAMGLFFLLAIVFLFLAQSPSMKTAGLTFCWVALIFGSIWIHHHYFRPDRGVVITETTFYEIPGYAGKTLSLPISPGTAVTIRDKQDIWVKISLGRSSCWVPGFVVREI